MGKLSANAFFFVFETARGREKPSKISRRIQDYDTTMWVLAFSTGTDTGECNEQGTEVYFYLNKAGEYTMGRKGKYQSRMSCWL